MNLLWWTALLIILSFWIIGYYYVDFYGDVSAKEHKVSMAQTKHKHKMAGLEKEKKRLEESIQELLGNIEQHKKNGNYSS